MSFISYFVDEPLKDTEIQKCPKCGQLNVVNALSCWSCLVSFESEEIQHARRMHEKRFRLERAGDKFFGFLPIGAISLLIASGYTRRGRMTFIWSGLAALIASLLWKGRLQVPPFPEKPPIERLVTAILLYGMRDGATKIRLTAGWGVAVHYLINDKWKEQMKIPVIYWSDVRAELKDQTENWRQSIFFEMNEDRYEFAPHFERDFPLETLTLSLLP